MDSISNHIVEISIYIAGFVRDYYGDGVIWGSLEGDYEPADYVRMREAAWDAAEAFYGVS